MRPIALGEVVRNIFVRAVLANIVDSGRLRLPGWQFGFRKGYQCLHVLHRVEAMLLKAAEWGVPVLVARLDVASAFDNMAYDRLAGAMENAGMTPKEVFIVLREVMATTAFVRLGGMTDSEPVRLERGGRQGGPETPLLWCMYLQEALDGVVRGWSSRASSAGVDLEGWLTARGRGVRAPARDWPDTTSLLAWADDLFLFAHDATSLQNMLNEAIGALREYDLGVCPGKVQLLHSKWAPACSVVVGDQIVVSTGEMECLGCTLQHDGGSARQMDRAVQKGNALFQKHKAMLTNRTTPLKVRFQAWGRTVGTAMRWGLAAFPRSAEQLKALGRVQTRQLLQIVGQRPKAGECVAAWQRRRHVWLKTRMERWGIQKLPQLVQQDLHGWAGHVVREAGPIYKLLRWRDATWWHMQAGSSQRPARPEDRRPQAGRPTRWEYMLLRAHGIGWHEFAADRTQWRRLATATCRVGDL
jgi:hypothetical protein